MARHHRHVDMHPTTRGRLRAGAAIVCLALLPATSALAAPGPAPKKDLAPPNLPRLLGDLRTEPRADGSYPVPMRRFDVALPPGAAEAPFYFTAADDRHGRELWRIRPDGSPERLTDVCPGPCDSFEAEGSQYVATLDDGRAVFAADDGETGEQLWVSDGTEPGTLRLTPRLPAPSVESIGPVPLDGYVYSGGTSAFDTDPATLPAAPRDLLRVGDRIVFWTGHRAAFWALDGTTPAASFLIDGCPDACRGVWDRLFGLDVDAAGIPHKLVFPMRSVPTGQVIAATDGTRAGTRTLQALCPGGPGSCLPFDLVALAGDQVAFRVDRKQVWRTDGTPLGTRRLATLEDATWVEHLAPAPGAILAVTYYSGTETLWRLPILDGEGAQPIRLEPAGGPLSVAGGDSFQPSGPFVFSANSEGSGYEVWRSDGSSAGTHRLADLVDGSISSNPFSFQSWNGKVYFTADDRRVGRELYATDGTVAGTARVRDLRGDPDGSRPSDFVEIRGRLLFLADATNPGQLSPYGNPTDYVPAGDLFTVVGDRAVPLLERRRARGLTRIGDRAFFVARNLPPGELDWTFDFEPWITDGTPGGTHLLAAIADGAQRSYARDAVLIPTPRGDRILFFADQSYGARIWISDGAPGGTELLADIDPSWDNVHPDEACTDVCSPPYPPTRIYPRESRRLGSRVVFIGRDPSVGEELWITDGTAAGTHNLLDVAPGDAHSYPEGLVALGESLFFTAGSAPSEEDSAVRDLWVTDAAGEATLLAADLGATLGMAPLVSTSGSRPPRVAMLTHRDQDLEEPRYALWVSDGTPGGTERVAAFELPVGQLTAADGLVYFSLATENRGTELARSDGTPEGTFLLGDLYPGERGSSPTILATHGREVVFGATDGTHPGGGTELWASNGEPGDARNLSRIGPRLQAPTAAFFAGGGRLYVAADDGAAGHEPWVLGDMSSPVLCESDPFTLCLADRFRIRVRWSVEPTGTSGTGRVVQDAGTADTGFFWFFGPDNLELAVKVLDGTGSNGHHWLFYGALSDVQYTLVAEDLLTGSVREYTNPSGNLCGAADIEAFREPELLDGASRTSAPAGVAAEVSDKTGTCGSSPGTLCLRGRFEISAVWQTDAARGSARPIPYGEETGMFWFFGPDNVELLVKVLDGRRINGKLWVFYGALSDVEYTIRVVDTETGAERIYDNQRGNLCGNADVEAFDG